MSTSTIAPPTGRDESGWFTACFANSGRARLLKGIAGMFLAAGIFGLVDRVANISPDLNARRTWPTADAEIVSANQTDDDANPSLKVSLSDHKRYWVEYEVRFAVAAEECLGRFELQFFAEPAALS
jgi:hypothetical protein